MHGDGRLTDALCGRAGIDGVRWMLSARPLRRALREELAALLAAGASLGPLGLHRAKLKPGRKLSAWYDLRVLVDGTPRRRAVAATWVLPDEFKDGGPDPAEAAMQAEAAARGLAAPFERLHAARPRQGMTVRVAPLDGRFPQLVRASDPAHAGELVAAGCRARGLPPPRTAGWTVTAVRYRPGQRHVLRYDPVPAGQPGGSVFAKLYRDGRSAPAFELAEAVADHLDRAGIGLRAARPLALLPDDDLLLYPQVGGGPLAGLLGAPRTDLHGLLGLAGAALRSLQHDPALAGLRGLRAHDLDGELRAIARAAEHVDALLPATGRAIAELLERASELHARLPGEDAVFAHGDFKADHLWVAPEGLTLLDFDTCSLADPALDVGKFLADLDYWYARHDLPGLAAAQQAFLDGYCGGSPPPARRSERARLYEALVLTKITLRRVRLFDPDWAERTERLVDRAGGLLSALQAARTPAGHASPP